MRYQFFSNTTYFVTYKTCNNGSYYFSDEEKDIILSKLLEARSKFIPGLKAFAILSNHYHLLIENVDSRAAQKFFQLLNGGSSFIINKDKNSKFNYWGIQDRINWPVKTEGKFFQFLAYVVANPWRHGLVREISDLKGYRYCNYDQVCEDYGEAFIQDLILNRIKKDDE
ncbi:TPA: hypothetical protein DF272_01235 [Candidatus Falkowbacteria bacterium]|nr:hypothetical protein [Candidatus Falkowbacteria bacterium]